MSKPKELKELTEQEFNTLKESGLLSSIYPDAPDSFIKVKDKRPKLVENPDWIPVINLCESYLDDLASEKYTREIAQCIFESVMIALYGLEVWDYINELED